MEKSMVLSFGWSQHVWHNWVLEPGPSTGSKTGRLVVSCLSPGESHEWTWEQHMSRESNKTLSDTLDFTAHITGGHTSQRDQWCRRSRSTVWSCSSTLCCLGWETVIFHNLLQSSKLLMWTPHKCQEIAGCALCLQPPAKSASLH